MIFIGLVISDCGGGMYMPISSEPRLPVAVALHNLDARDRELERGQGELPRCECQPASLNNGLSDRALGAARALSQPLRSGVRSSAPSPEPIGPDVPASFFSAAGRRIFPVLKPMGLTDCGLHARELRGDLPFPWSQPSGLTDRA